jgi:hypothetical protein
MTAFVQSDFTEHTIQNSKDFGKISPQCQKYTQK